MSKLTRGGTREANRRRERHARKTRPPCHNFLRHGKRALWGMITSLARWGHSVRTGICAWGTPTVDCGNDGVMTFTFPGRIEPYIRMDFIIGPGPELTAERQRFLSVLEARP